MKTNLKVKIRNVDFSIACETGEEEKIERLATHVDRRLNFLAQSFPGTNLMTLFFINSIMIEDEINDLKEHNRELSIAFDSSEKNKISDNMNSNSTLDIHYNEISHYIEKLVESIEE